MESFKKNFSKKEITKESSFFEYLKRAKSISINEEEETEETEDSEDEYLEKEKNDETTSSASDDEDDEDEDYEKDEDEEEENSSCPISTKDGSVNIENRQKAIDEFGYGPEKIEESNDDFWKEKKIKFMVKTVELAKERKCNNCAAFSLKSSIIKCLDDGIDKKESEDSWDSDKENRGFCEFLDFKSHSQRTCNSWVEGGPLKD